MLNLFWFPSILQSRECLTSSAQRVASKIAAFGKDPIGGRPRCVPSSLSWTRSRPKSLHVAKLWRMVGRSVWRVASVCFFVVNGMGTCDRCPPLTQRTTQSLLSRHHLVSRLRQQLPRPSLMHLPRPNQHIRHLHQFPLRYCLRKHHPVKTFGHREAVI